MKSAAEVVADYWATDHKGAKKAISWLEHPTILRNVCRRITGDPDVRAIDWFQRKYLPETVELALSLGCGDGLFERDAVVRINLAQKFHANDISPGAIQTAKLEAEKAGIADRIDYSVVNLDEDGLPQDTYDAVFGLPSIHHVFRLERLFKNIRASMKPGALFYLDEYVGPSRFQTTPKVTAIINEIRAALPDRLKRSLFTENGSRILGDYTPSPVEHFERHDPSEAVRSSEIVPLLKMYFDVIEYRPFGGTILHMLLSGMTGNFDESNDGDQALLNVLMRMEEALEDHIGGSDFAVIVARPKG
jgi:SAM-dependent methyltransferase